MLTEPGGESRSTKARLFGDEGSDELRRRVAKARFLQALDDNQTDDRSVTLTHADADEDDGVGEGTEPAAATIEVERVRVGRFAVLRKLGQGGMGVVYAAYDEDLDRKVALKLIRQDLARDDRGRVRMQREAQALARLSHPNVVQVHEIGQWDGHDYVAMEFVAGHTLSQWRELGERTWAEVLDVMIQAGRGLAAAHHAGLVHRDFKPANLMVGEDGRARVLDFGLARAASEVDSHPHMRMDDVIETGERLEDSGSGQSGHSGQASRTSAFDRMLTATGALLGTPAYMSPEQHLGQSATAHSDQFSFCLVLYESLFGERPYKAKNRKQYAAKVTAGEFVVPGPNADVPARGVPTWLRKAVCRGLAPNPDDRWPSMDALLDELSRNRQRLWTRLGVAAGLVAALGTGLAIAGDSRAPLCEPDRSAVEAIWGSSAREAVSRAITSSGHAQAGQRLAEVEQSLDRYADALVEARRESCDDRWIAQTQSDAQHGLRNTCLDQRERELAAIVEVLEQADADIVERVPGILASVGDIGLCARVDLLERNMPVPKDAAAIAAIAEVRKDLARGHVAREAGRLQAAELFASDARARASEIDYAPLLGEVAYLEGANAFRKHDDQAAEAALLEAARRATAVGDLQLQAEIALLEARTALRMGQAANYQIAVAEASVAQLGEVPALQSELHFVKGLALREAERREQALAEFDRAVEIAETDFAGHEHQLAGVLIVRAAIRSRIVGRQQQAREDLERALALGLDPDNVNAIDALFDLGVLELENDHNDEAERLLELALAGYERIYGNKYTFVGHGQLALARIDIDRGDYDAAGAHVERALDILDEAHPDHLYALDAEAALARVRGREDLAVEIFSRALEVALRGGSRDEIAELRFQLGYSLARLGQYEQALTQLEQSIAALDGDPPSADIVRPLYQRGRVLRELGQLGASLESLERAVQLLSVEDGRPLFAGEAHVELALTLERLGQIERARSAARTAESRLAEVVGTHRLLDPVSHLLQD